MPIKKATRTPAEDTKRGAATAPTPKTALGVSIRDPVRKDAIEQWMASQNSPGNTKVAHADRLITVTDLKRPCGILPLDIDCGGGLPAGRLSIISGPDNAGKSFLLVKYLTMHQKLYGASSAVAIAAIEPFNFKRAIKCGMVLAVPDEVLTEWNKERELVGVPPYTDEEIRYFKRQIGEVIFLRGVTGEQTMDIVLQAIASKYFGIVGVDSFSILLPEADAEKAVGETPKRAGNANLLTDFAKKYTPLTNSLNDSNDTTVIGLMQARSNPDKASAGHMAKYMKDWVTVGAYAIRHQKSVDIQIWPGKKLKKTVNGTEYTAGKQLHWLIAKGKDGTHDGRQGDVSFWHEEFFPEGTDDVGSVITEGIRRGTFQLDSKGLKVIHPVTKHVVDTAQNPTQFQKMLSADFEYELAMRRYVLLSAGVQCLYLR
jgi:RecA/RadA recombinase